MNIGAHHPLAFHQGFWPFPSVHPAFLHTQYQNYQNSHPVNYSNKSNAFTIDAILNRDHVDELHNKKSSMFPSSPRKETDTSSQRHQRLFEASHPYLSTKDKTTPMKKVTEFFGK